MSAFLYDSRDARCKTPFGAVSNDQPVVFRVFLPPALSLDSPALLVFYADRWDAPAHALTMCPHPQAGTGAWRCVFTPPSPQLCFYLFAVQSPEREMYIVRDANGFGTLSSERGEMWQLTVYSNTLQTPDFLRQGVMYQIFPDRFCNSGIHKTSVPHDRRMHTDWYEQPDHLPDKNGNITNSDYFGGDLAGITEKLSYLHSLGVRTLYLNPIFEAHSNHRYDTADYMKIDPLLGSEQDLRTLCEQAQALGIHILLDGVFNHTGSDSVYFNKNRRYGNGGAYNDPDSPYRSWYDFTDYPHGYRAWWGIDTLPNVNEHDTSYREFICGENGVLKHWLRAGVSGWRLDVADELPDDFLDAVCAAIKGHDPQAAVIGEVWEDASNKVSYGVRRRYLLGGQLDCVMNYPFRSAILDYVRQGDGAQFFHALMTIVENYPPPVLEVLMNPLSTHDVERALTVLAAEPAHGRDREWQAHNNMLSAQQYAHGKRLLKLAAVLQYMLPGVPCIYYGDEAGLYGYRDPFNRACYPWEREDDELIAFFRALGKLRLAYPELCGGKVVPIAFTPAYAAFVRHCGNMQFYVAVNRLGEPVSPPLPEAFARADAALGELQDGALLPFGYVVFVLRGREEMGV